MDIFEQVLEVIATGVIVLVVLMITGPPFIGSGGSMPKSPWSQYPPTVPLDRPKRKKKRQ